MVLTNLQKKAKKKQEESEEDDDIAMDTPVARNKPKATFNMLMMDDDEDGDHKSGVKLGVFIYIGNMYIIHSCSCNCSKTTLYPLSFS